jgi:ppGpp synthetase/RelA/SpoT-type nucleotidyltranferase
MTVTTLEQHYRARYIPVLKPLAGRVKEHLDSYLSDCDRIDLITARAKGIASFLAKAAKVEDGQAKYGDPINQIQDQVGARIVTFYLSDVPTIAAEIESYFHAIEEKTLVPESDSEFGYFGKHYVLLLPTDVIRSEEQGRHPPFFELQIKTLFQHAWSQANHDLGYKSTVELTRDQKRKIAYTSAQAWGADEMFERLGAELRNQPATPDLLKS